MIEKEPLKCDRCGWNISVYRIHGSAIGVRVAGCPNCKITALARTSDEEALKQWKIGHRIDRDGVRICKCCTVG